MEKKERIKNGLLAVKCFCMNDETENGFKFASSATLS